VGALKSLAELVTGAEGLAGTLCAQGTLNDIVEAVSDANPSVQHAAHATIRAVARESVGSAQAVIDAGVVEVIRSQLELVEPVSREHAVKTLNVLVAADPDLASDVMGGDMLEVMVKLLEIRPVKPGFKDAIAATISDTCAHGEEFALAVVNSGSVPTLWKAATLSEHEPIVLAELLSCLSQICKYSKELASHILEVPKSISLPARHLSGQNQRLRRSAASLVYQQVKYEGRQCFDIVESGDIAGIVRFIQLERHTPLEATNAILALGHIANVDTTLARAVGESGAVEELMGYSENTHEEEVLAAIGWMTTRIAVHGHQCARPLAMKGMLGSLLATYAKVREGGQAQNNLMEALVSIVENCESHKALEALVHEDTPAQALDVILSELASALRESVDARRSFVTSGAMLRLQLLEPLLLGEGRRLLREINTLYPDQVVAYYREGLAPLELDGEVPGVRGGAGAGAMEATA